MNRRAMMLLAGLLALSLGPVPAGAVPVPGSLACAGGAGQAVIDRVEDGVAVLLMGAQGEEVHLPAGQLPAGAAEGDWLQYEGSRVGDCPGRLALDAAETARRRAAVRQKLDRLRRGR